jgi:hypothetical protein
LRIWRLLLIGLAVLLATAHEARADKTLADFRYFRALSIDLLGRIPSRNELAAFEGADFDLDAWIDARLQGAAYADRIVRVYMDLLRLEVGNVFTYRPDASVLRRQTILGPDGRSIYVYYRYNQRRQRPETDGTFCLTQAESGLQFPNNIAPIGTATAVAQATLDQHTRVVKPWWLYRDYRAAAPSQRYDAATWAQSTPGYVPAAALLVDNDGTTPTTEVRVCAEEAATAPTGTVFASGRTTRPSPDTPPPFGRADFPPLDSAFATKSAGQPITCHSTMAQQASTDCGCGPGLERCMPGATFSLEPPAFAFPSRLPLGQELPFDSPTQAQSSWERLWWSEEAVHYLRYLLGQDRDFREVLSGHATVINGPLAQFYRDLHAGTLASQAAAFNYIEPEPLFDAAQIPADLLPHDVARWSVVADRGPHASGILTMPVFLTKFGTRRARAHVLWQAFACKDFVAGKIQLMPSTEPDLTKRPGCNICHATLEPLAAHFARIQENNWTFLPPSLFPAQSTRCASADPGQMSYACQTFYDPAFTSATSAMLRGAYASEANADAGPQALAGALTSTTQFESCVAQNVASSFLGRSLTPDDAALQQSLAQTFAQNGYKMRALVRALVKHAAYRAANNESSSTLRDGGAL